MGISEKEIKEGNSHIEKLVGEKVFKRKKITNLLLLSKEIHNDWNVLIDLRDRIISLSNQHSVAIYNTHTSITVYNGGKGKNKLFSKTVNLESSIISTWQAIVEYSKWHNDNFEKYFVINDNKTEHNNGEYKIK